MVLFMTTIAGFTCLITVLTEIKIIACQTLVAFPRESTFTTGITAYTLEEKGEEEGGVIQARCLHYTDAPLCLEGCRDPDMST